MRIRKNKAPIVTGPELPERPVIAADDLAMLRSELVAALVAKSEDPVLISRYRAAIDTGCPVPDLADVPRHRRLDTVFSAIEEHEAATAGGPCDLCGTRRPRYAPGQTDEPSFRTISGGRACDWCADFLVSCDQDRNHLREVVGNALMGTKGLPAGGSQYRYAGRVGDDYLVPFFNETTATASTPWAHLTNDAHRLERLRAVALKKCHPITNFCRTRGDVDLVSIPGITTTPWSEADIPKPETKYMGLSSRGRALAAENERAYAALKDERAARERTTAKRLAELKARDERIAAQMAAMSEDDRADYLERLNTSVVTTNR